MGMQINNNLMANNAYRNLNATQDNLSKSMEKLSSGLRINRAADDAAGLAISEGLKSQVTGSTVAARNAQDGISLIQTTEGALSEVHSVLQRMRDLAVQGASDTNNGDARAAIQKEADSLGKELYRITQSTNFNGINLLQGGSKNIQVGTAGTANDTIAVTLGNVATATGTLSSADGIAGATGFDVSTNGAAQTTITAIDAAITTVSAQRSDLGANQNRLDHAIKTLTVSGENLQAAQSRIADTDMAAEMVKYTKANILSQAGTAMLAQANQSGQGVLSLLR
ncbi:MULTISPECIES: flagellin [unclassified Paenarthrobacter]|uniref:flagellin N-terminal helical domain-containing protein n=1 Tax=Micrococcaceae TaxID=1268 RepID=UPI001F45D9DB|nr:flagellin [Paenarthrobacter sp. AR 02]MCF3138902.1 flagellin [Paenarthrobacter sp. AR 02]